MLENAKCRRQGRNLVARRQADAEKRAALIGMAEKIETESGSVMERVGARTAGIAANADDMSASAARTQESAQAAHDAATQALANAQTVAGAAEQLTASIHEIGSQVRQSADVVGRAVTMGGETRTTMEALNAQVERIGAVAVMIAEIASRTNLLALNATIEAARAGDAGKGFAVVASEVKQLANQTARSTEEITRHIDEVRSATGVSVGAVARMEQTIGEVSAIADSIAAAVEEQGAATSEIARNVAETASAANEVTRRVAEVTAEAQRTGSCSARVHDDSAALNGIVQELKTSLVRVVRTSTSEVDRRQHVRHHAAIPCRLTAGGRTGAARLVDISLGGASVSGGPNFSEGARGTLQVDGLGMTLNFVVRAAETGLLHIAFDLGGADADRLQHELGRLGLAEAA